MRWVMKAVRCAGTDDVSRAAKFLLKPRTYLVRLSHLTHRSRKLQGWLHVYAPIAGVVMYLLGKPVLVQLCKGLNTTGGKSHPLITHPFCTPCSWRPSLHIAWSEVPGGAFATLTLGPG